jgi:hypothetical protein
LNSLSSSSFSHLISLSSYSKLMKSSQSHVEYHLIRMVLIKP